MRKSLGDKRHEISPGHIRQISDIFTTFEEGGHSKIFDTTDFGYRKIIVERPLRLNFQASPERIERLKEQSAFARLALSKKKNPDMRAMEEEAGRQQQQAILHMLEGLPDALFKDRAEFEKILNRAVRKAKVKLSVPLRKAILAALSERDEAAEMCRDKDGQPEPDTELRDIENVPLRQDVTGYFEREVKPYVVDAWVNTAIRDHKDGEVGRVGYEINFNRYFHQYQPPRPLEEIETDIQALEQEIMEMLREVAA
jgi:type I restriction enzyme M protein